MPFNRFDEECEHCSCYINNWDDELNEEGIDHDCSLEEDVLGNKPCYGFDDIRKDS